MPAFYFRYYLLSIMQKECHDNAAMPLPRTQGMGFGVKLLSIRRFEEPNAFTPIDPKGTVVLYLVGFEWAKPVPRIIPN